MADIAKLNLNGTDYVIKDEVARDLITALQNEGYVKANDIVDVLTSTNANVPLSANQGRELNATKIDNITISGNILRFTANENTIGSIELPTLTASQSTQLNTAYNHSQSAHAPSNAEANVQSDWSVTDTNSDAYIANKPTNLSAFVNDVNYATETYVDTAIENIGTTGGGNIDTSYDEENEELTIADDNMSYNEDNEELTFIESDIKIPTSTSQLVNDSDFVNSVFVINKIAEASLSGGEVDLSGYVTKETGNANQIIFADGQTFQAKLEAGTLKGEQGIQGIQGLKGDKGDTGQDGLTTTISVNGTTYTHSNGTITLPNYPTVVSTANGITIADTAGNFTATNVEGALAELFQFVSNGKSLIASAITDMGISTSNTDTFQVMANNIRMISGGSGETYPGDSTMDSYIITYNLTNCTSSNNLDVANSGDTYSTSIIPNSNHTISGIITNMNGVDITSSTVDSDNNINIPSVTGDISITAIAEASSDLYNNL